jgi:hypothetical protein
MDWSTEDIDDGSSTQISQISNIHRMFDLSLSNH